MSAISASAAGHELSMSAMSASAAGQELSIPAMSTSAPLFSTASAVYTWLGSPAGGLALWGLTTRGLLLVASLSLASLALQLRGLSGVHGVSSSRELLRTIARDFGPARALLLWPTLLWAQLALPAALGDALLVGLPAVASAAALTGALAGGAAGWLGLFAAWSALLSIDVGGTSLVYPWDSLLLEALFLALWLPLLASGGILSSSLPTPLLAAAFRLLAARVLLGFGRMKFVGSTAADAMYIRHFMITQPMLSRAGAALHAALPAWAWRAALAGMFVVEIPLPAMALLAPVASIGWGVGNVVRIFAVVAVAGLMAGIQVAGNFGTFNLLTTVLMLPYLHHSASLLNTRLDAHVLDSPAHAAFAALAVAYLLPSMIFYLPLNSWVNVSWPWWSGLHLLSPPALFESAVAYLRALAPLRLVASYGVFPPHSFPAQRWVVRYELRCAAGPSDVGSAPWLPLPCRYLDRALCTVAPHHPRIDHALFYEGMGLCGYAPAGMLGHHSPYKLGWQRSEWLRLQLRVASAHLPGGLRRGGHARALLEANTTADAAAAALDAFVGGARAVLLDSPFWAPRDAPEEDVSDARAALPPPCYGASPLAAEWEYVGPLVQARAVLRHQLPAHEYRRREQPVSSCAGDADWIETLVGEHLPAVTALHLLRRRRMGGGVEEGGGAPPSLHRRGGVPAAPEVAAPQYALAQDEAFLALERGSGRSAADFPADCVIWRRAALAPPTNHATGEDCAVELAWRFLGMLRYAAACEAGRRAALSEAPPAHPSPPAPDGLVSVDCVLDHTRLLVDTPAATLLEAAVAGARAVGLPLDGVASSSASPPLPDVDASLDPALANVLFTFAQLPGVVAAVRRAFSPLQLREVEHGVASLTLPLLQTLEAACWRPPPAPPELASELAAAGIAPDSAFSAWYARLGDMMTGTPPRPSGRPPLLRGHAAAADAVAHVPYVASDGTVYAVLAFAENDDAGEPGCLRNSWRLGAYAHWLLLVGGRRAYVHATALPAAGAASPAVALARLVPDPASLGPALMGSEAGAFLHATLQFDVWAASARRVRSPGLLARPSAALPLAALSPLPGFIELNERLAVHHARMHTWGHSAGALVAGVAAPAWGLDASGDWVLMAPPADRSKALYGT